METTAWAARFTELERSLATDPISGRDGDAAAHRLARYERLDGSVTYPDLPVAQRRDDLLAAIRDHQVVVVAGETGSGKTTQLPKICLELGRGVRGLIGHTQPRRIAARSVAERLAEELGTDLGDVVGYTVRFTDQVSTSTLVRLMTDGILLAEIQRDPLLNRYDTLIIDEAHERSLTIDFLLGYLKRLLPRRPDLKVVITSATIDPEAFARHFGTPDEPAPIIEVSGRTYPVEVRYRPLEAEVPDDDELGEKARPEPRDQTQGILDAVQELATEPERGGPGDILVFLSGEREIRDTADALGDATRRGGLPANTEIVPLYGRLSAAEQHRVFAAHPAGVRRVVLATNVAETSLTVPGIRYVVDTGTARISRYSQRTKVQRLPIEPISQASANQRAGRCGRLADGVCIRLYSQEDYESRPEFTEPEILRTGLAAVILQMTSLGLGEVADFPFLDPPDARQVKDGVALLHELAAIDPSQSDPNRRLTGIGRTLARLPVDPRLARMLVEAHHGGVLREVLPIVAGLAIMDPRERPTDAQAQADQAHARFKDPTSDFLAYLNLWRYLQEQQRELSSSAFRRLCRAEYLHYLRVREWQDLHQQLVTVLKRARMAPPRGEVAETVDADAVHLALLAGLLSQVGVLDERSASAAAQAARQKGRRPPMKEYLGARGAKFVIAPGSSLFRTGPDWVMVAELVETSRLFGRTAAKIDPLWIERLAGHLVRRSYSEPRWERRRGSAVATEKVTLYGVPVVPARTVGYARVDPEVSRELFIRHALVEGDWRTNHRFFHENRRLLEDVGELEDRARRRDMVVDDDALFDFYDQRLPADVVSAVHFDSWWKGARRERPDLLSFWTSMLLTPAARGVDEAEHPTSWKVPTPAGELDLPLTYQFEPGTAADGVTVHVPLAVLNQVPSEPFGWQIPGLRVELVTELIRSLPKAVRKEFAPAPDNARTVLQRLDATEATPPGALLPTLAAELAAMRGVDVPVDAFDLTKVPTHLRITFRIEDEDRRPVGEGKDLDALRERLAAKLRAAISGAVTARPGPGKPTTSAGHALNRDGLTAWPDDLPELPQTVEGPPTPGSGGIPVTGFPALVDRGKSVSIRVFESRAEQQRMMGPGTRRLIAVQVPSPAKNVLPGLSQAQKLALASAPHRDASALFDDCLQAAIDNLVLEHGGPEWTASGFADLLGAVRSALLVETTRVMVQTATVLDLARQAGTLVRGTSSPALLASLADARAQLEGLVHPGFVTEAGVRKLPDLERYLQALLHRLERLPERAQRDQALLYQVRSAQEEYDTVVAALPRERRGDPDVTSIRWTIEELRVSLFGGGIRTAYPVSPQRITKALAALS
ncbi:ATP-dependent RNA helicase HrpA [Spongisporangium articulatum]|uniref:ATP-dependent RNA helicase HrpA n=1 Tax=Spongisporangium articulatum TaxID=3362603 RepID=A0ABW8APP1_9ACTN